ncbi:cell surface protein [Enterococcus florum]|uniref:Cell surface protein n=1 Tax=Enterococcus florum TaxID=2480627 RepID=A0A4P5PCI6_9ENTE|nr:DUF916 and DUF3324 domain-containing protein [Enterococcus florum]GCF94214.1 cell surface protein [Enterococcus florum]
MKKWMLLLAATISGISFVLGNACTATAETASFTAIPQLPDNQLDKQASSFHLQVFPNLEQTMYLRLENTTDQAITVLPSLSRGHTNEKGSVVFDQSARQLDDSAQANIEEIASVDRREIRLAPHAVQDLPIQIKMPAVRLKGIQLGAVCLRQKNTDQTTEIPLILQSSEPEQLPTQLVLEQAEATQKEDRNVISQKIRNLQPKYVRLSEVKGSVTRKGEEHILYQTKQQEVELAPNDAMNLIIPLKGRPFEPGVYVATFKVWEGSQSWKLTKEFVIKNDQCQKLNKQDAALRKRPTLFQQYKWVVLLQIVLVAAILRLSMYLRVWK